MPPRASFPLSKYDARTAPLQGLLMGAVVIAGLYLGERSCYRSRSPFS
jgi:hypothetical protein